MASIRDRGGDDRISLKPVTIARDLGKEVEIASGLSADDRVIESPPDGIEAGDRVRIAGASDTPVSPKTVAARRVGEPMQVNPPRCAASGRKRGPPT